MVPQKITIDPEVIKSYGITLGEFLYTLAYMWGFNMSEVADGMVEKGSAKYEGDIVEPSTTIKSAVENCISSKRNIEMTDDEILQLAKEMKALYPKGYNADGTPWAEGPKLIAERLKSFFRKYGNYGRQEILSATKSYVERKQDTPYFRLLKYFIYKDSVGINGNYEPTSDLYTMLEMGSYDMYTFPDEWATEVK